MILLAGTLSVRSSLNVKSGRLTCSIGQFRVQSEALNRLDEGDYEGVFEITQITSGCYTEEGRYYVELEAAVKTMAFPIQRECAAEEVNTSVALSCVAPEVNTPAALARETSHLPLSQPEEGQPALESDKDERLFGDLWPLAAVIQLDMTQSRDRLRVQTERLKELGYHFNAQQQAWHKAVNMTN